MPPTWDSGFRWSFGPSPQGDCESPALSADTSLMGKSDGLIPRDNHTALTKPSIVITPPNAMPSQNNSSGLSPSLESISFQHTAVTSSRICTLESHSLPSGITSTGTMGCSCSKCCKKAEPTVEEDSGADGIPLHSLPKPPQETPLADEPQKASSSPKKTEKFTPHRLSPIGEEEEIERDSVVDMEASSYPKHTGATPADTEQLNDHEEAKILAPIKLQLQRLKATTPESMPTLHPDLKAKTHPQLLKQRLHPIGQFIVRKTRNREDRAQIEIQLWQFVAQNYWPLPSDDSTYLHIHEIFHNAQFKLKKTTTSAPDNARMGEDSTTDEPGTHSEPRKRMCKGNLRQMMAQMHINMTKATSQSEYEPCVSQPVEAHNGGEDMDVDDAVSPCNDKKYVTSGDAHKNPERASVDEINTGKDVEMANGRSCTGDRINQDNDHSPDPKASGLGNEAMSRSDSLLKPSTPSSPINLSPNVPQCGPGCNDLNHYHQIHLESEPDA